ncbi:hypothetical protein NPIL_254441 [Nephila pilipes]|uniref:Uncharacterized protein n=1 Tax=Nephila pilipes TaxID=299642 RepID=A0A8X6T2J9_NEPPI|nr:hypothetical protein NPIL_254441 [Nephila pilipes]
MTDNHARFRTDSYTYFSPPPPWIVKKVVLKITELSMMSAPIGGEKKELFMSILRTVGDRRQGKEMGEITCVEEDSETWCGCRII